MELKDNGNFIKILYRKYVVPGILALLAGTIGTLITSIMAGNYFGRQGLFIVGVFMPILYIYTTLGALIGVGAANATNRFVAKNQIQAIKKMFTLATILSLVLGVAITCFAFFFKSEIIRLLFGNAAITTEVSTYFNYLILGGIVSMYIYTPMNFTRIDGKPNVSMFMFLAMAGANLLANFILLEWFKLGIEAIAIGSFFGAAVAVLLGGYFVFFKKGNVGFTKISGLKESIKEIVALGSPMALNNFYNFLRVFFINAMLLGIGAPEGIAVFAVINTLNPFITSIASGIGQAMVPLVGVLNDKSDVQSVRALAKEAFQLGNCIFTMIAVFIIIFRRDICKFFVLDGLGEAAGADTAILYFGLSLFFAVNNTVLSFYFTAIGNIWLANGINFLKGVLYSLASAFILGGLMGAAGVWLAMLLAEVFTLATTVVLVRGIAHNKGNLSNILLLNISDEKEKKYIAFSVGSEENDIAAASEAISEFSEKRGFSVDEVMFLGLAIEEILNLIKTQRRVVNTKFNCLEDISVRLYILDDMRMLTFMYHGTKFNPIQYFQCEMENDFEKSIEAIGIKYIIEQADIITFAETFGVNNLSIKF